MCLCVLVVRGVMWWNTWGGDAVWWQLASINKCRKHGGRHRVGQREERMELGRVGSEVGTGQNFSSIQGDHAPTAVHVHCLFLSAVCHRVSCGFLAYFGFDSVLCDAGNSLLYIQKTAKINKNAASINCNQSLIVSCLIMSCRLGWSNVHWHEQLPRCGLQLHIQRIVCVWERFSLSYWAGFGFLSWNSCPVWSTDASVSPRKLPVCLLLLHPQFLWMLPFFTLRASRFRRSAITVGWGGRGHFIRLIEIFLSDFLCFCSYKRTISAATMFVWGRAVICMFQCLGLKDVERKDASRQYPDTVRRTGNRWVILHFLVTQGINK